MADPTAKAVARPEVLALRMSEIREVANEGMGRPDVLKFWVGESDQPTPAFIREATAQALMDGHTYYTHNLGRPDLREALSGYLERLHGRPFGMDRLAITSSGVNALMLVAQAVVSPGDKVVVTTPAWPNIVEIPRILSARLALVPLDPAQGRWRLDLDRLMDALTPDTKVLFLNSPNNPTGWTLPAEDRAAILARCREYGIWLITDDPYERLIFGPGKSAPSFLPLAEDDERVVSTNTFSKAWRMTGWRMGWMVLPRSLTDRIGVVVEYNTSCAPDFIQTGAAVALTKGEASIADLRAELTAAKDLVLGALRQMPGVEAPEPEGGMYAFFRVDGTVSSLALAQDMLRKAGVGLAPGSAFGDEGQGWLRWCFANRPEKNAEGLQRLADYLKGR
ncbi:pyridoxal phosphate-dependent aminotransferase [Phenylobacterium sp.]|uniref:pyridoxal phosphate-dependent aminotransferase n=1 Tax=Phenylobacterium sp. TaxID=1871053 RepID=UPI001206EEC9|nr:pyridoxal phosphate-dependent aminotransferase [Phenylobacterium sp.]THD63674.1 MAG: pyridoxal phosphate-dependent aminotransferase [Phenylobacterium sp.]